MKKTIENCRRMRILAPEHRANVKCDDCRGRDVCPTSDYVGRDGEYEETVADVMSEMRRMLNRIEAAHRREMAQHDKKKRNCDGDRTDWRWYWGRYVTTQVCPCERKTATPEKHLRYFLNWLFLPKWVTGNDRDGEGSAK